MTPSDPLTPIIRRQRRETRLLFSVLGDALENAIARYTTPGEPLTEAHRRAIMAEVDVGLNIVWGARRNDPDAAVRVIVLRDTKAARLKPLEDAVKEWRRVMPDALREAVEDQALS